MEAEGCACVYRAPAGTGSAALSKEEMSSGKVLAMQARKRRPKGKKEKARKKPEAQQKVPSAPPPPPPPPPLPEPAPPEPEEEILGSDDEEQEDPSDYCKVFNNPLGSLKLTPIPKLPQIFLPLKFPLLCLDTAL